MKIIRQKTINVFRLITLKKELRNSWKCFLTLVFGAGTFLLFGLLAFPAYGAGEICFCHGTGSKNNPINTICTSNSGQQEGHTNHGDPNFGCFCGDGICDAGDGETAMTCPQDCGTDLNCGNGTVEDVEECGEPQLSACTADEICIGCRCAPPQPSCFSDVECSDDGEFCNGEEICLNTRICGPGTSPCDDQDVCTTDTCDAAAESCENDPIPQCEASEFNLEGSSCTISLQSGAHKIFDLFALLSLVPMGLWVRKRK